MATATVTAKGQITIPKEIRKALGLEVGDKVVFLLDGKQAIVTPVERKTIGELRGCLPATKETPGWPEVRRATRKAMAELIMKGMG